MALGREEPRHLSAGSLPLPGPQSVSLMFVWGARSCPGWRGGGGGDPREGRWRGRGEAPRSRAGPRRRKLQARCVRVGAARQPAPWLLGGSRRSLSGVWLPAHVRCLAPSGAAGRTAGPLTSWGGCPASSPRTPLAGLHGRREVHPAAGPRPWRTRRPKVPTLSARLTLPSPSHKLRAPSALGHGTVAPPQDLGAPFHSPSGGGEALAFRSVLVRLPCKPRSQKGWEGSGPVRGAAASAPEFAGSRLSEPRSPQRPTWAFWCASRSGTALQPPGLPALLVTDRLAANEEARLACI